MASTIAPNPPYDIAIVSRLTGLSSPNLRMWEKRYEVVSPQRSKSGRRLYSEEDVRRLTLLKGLSDRGQAIRKTCNLSIDELEQLLLESTSKAKDNDEDVGGTGRRPGFGCRVIVVGEHMTEVLRSAEIGLPGTVTVAEYLSLESAEAAEIEEGDLLLVECPALFADKVSRVQQLIDRTNAVRAILIYFYSQARTLSALEDNLSRITAIRAPVSPGELQIACATDIALANRSARKVLKTAPEPREQLSDEIPDRQFTDHELARISQISSAIECECPHHLASLLSSLSGFERYSAECENRNEADAEMHAYLHRMTAHARAIVEDSLKVLVDFEGIDLDS